MRRKLLQPKSKSHEGAEGGALILVVEDVEEIRDGLEKLLKADGYRLDLARTEEDAVRVARCKPPDLILMSSGGSSNEVIAAAARLRERAALSEKVPIVLFSIKAVPEGAEVEIERSTYLTRPDNFDQLRRFLSRLLRKPSRGS